MTDSTEAKAPRKRKPEKPYEGFPMFAHPSGQWAKKINKRLAYFGVWANAEAALARLNREYPYLKVGQVPPAVADGCTLKTLCNEFLRAKEAKLDAGDLSPRTFRDYYKTCETILAHFGKERRVDGLRPEDFRDFRASLAKRLGSTSLKNERTRVCILFNFAHENKIIPAPISFGQHFDPPSARAIRRDRNEAGPKLFTREEILRLLEAADVQLRAMIFLGANGGLGNTDVASLPLSAVDLEKGWIDFPRPKTEVRRRIPVWPETVDALRAWLPRRPVSEEPESRGLVFLTRLGQQWVRTKRRKQSPTEEQKAVGPEACVPIDALSGQFGKLLKKLHINGRRGLGFYTLRHCFETQAGESKDQVCVDALMGHVDSSMAGVYREKISDGRLRAVVDVVRAWLFGKGGAA